MLPSHRDNRLLIVLLLFSVGSKALSVNQAIVVGAIFEFLGSLMGGAVVTTISKGVIAPSAMTDELELYVLIMFSTLAGAFVWLAFATYFSLPVSTTHSLMGSLIGKFRFAGRVRHLPHLTFPPCQAWASPTFP